MHAGRLVVAGLLVAGLLVAGSAGAEVYRWTDPDGTEHFTDNPSSVPANVKAKATRGADISTVSVVDARPVARVAPADGPAGAPARAEPVDARRSEREWRAAFRDVAERQARLEDEIEVDRRKVEDVNGLPVAARFHCAAMGGGVLFVPGAVAAGSSVVGSTVSVGGAVGQGGVGFTVGGGAVATQQHFFQTATPGVFAQPCVFAFNPEFERARERLELNRKALSRVKAEAADLERRASFEGVPREWRR